jgi:murein L,D-transpeptidase YcbB/YkuD
MQGRTSTRRAILALSAIAAMIGCDIEKGGRHQSGGEAASGGRWSPSPPATVRGVPLEAVRGALQQRLAAAAPDGIDADQWRHVHQLYASYQGSPLWIDSDGLEKDRGAALMHALLDATSDGLRLDAYPIGQIARALDSLRASKTATPELLADLDVQLSTAFAALGEDLLTGQVNPKSVSQDWHIDPKEERVDSALVRALATEPLDRSIAAMRPQDPEYEQLRTMLVRFRETAAHPWTTVPAGDALKPGQRGDAARLAALRQRLAQEGIAVDSAPAPTGGQPTGGGASASSAGAIYDHALAAGVAQFQARHAIGVDSILGKETVDAMNVPASFRLGQIAANLERYRWMPRALGDRYVIVNVPAFQLRAFDGGKTVIDMKVIVGADYEDRKTPVFSDTMTTVVFRPYWNVTDDIADKEIWPKANADPSYLERNDYETFNEGGKTRIRQRPGPENSLGLVKFLFPNDYNIYLHDTPHDELFDKDVRAFSHGCIRLEKPEALAQWVLGWSADSVQRAMQQGPDNKSVKVPGTIAVYIAYFTAFVRDGRLMFGNDLYARDNELVPAVAAGARPSQEAVRATDALRKYLEK